jgi:hypothetical protein
LVVSVLQHSLLVEQGTLRMRMHTVRTLLTSCAACDSNSSFQGVLLHS